MLRRVARRIAPIETVDEPKEFTKWGMCIVTLETIQGIYNLITVVPLYILGYFINLNLCSFCSLCVCVAFLGVAASLGIGLGVGLGVGLSCAKSTQLDSNNISSILFSSTTTTTSTLGLSTSLPTDDVTRFIASITGN